MTKINLPFVDLKKINYFYQKNFIKSLKRAISEANFIKGKKTNLLEKKIAHFFNSKYSLTVNSGTDALIISLKSLNLNKGDEVLTTSNTWISSAYAIALNNCKPIFIDVDINNFQMKYDLIEKHITKKTKAIIVTHLYGMPNNMTEICRIAKKYNIFVIEDIAQAHLAKFKNKIVGNFGDLACISFYPSKNLGALGDGGAILTNQKKLYLKCKSLANYGAVNFRDSDHKIIGFNSRLDELQAYFLLEKLNKLKIDTLKRNKLAKIYDKKCDELNIKRMPNYDGYFNAYHIYLIVIKNRDFIKNQLEKKNIKCQIHYKLPIHLQTAFKYLKYKKGDLPNTEYLSKNILSLPFYPLISKKKINYLFNNLKILLK